jgi:hypothetical protein
MGIAYGFTALTPATSTLELDQRRFTMVALPLTLTPFCETVPPRTETPNMRSAAMMNLAFDGRHMPADGGGGGAISA